MQAMFIIFIIFFVICIVGLIWGVMYGVNNRASIMKRAQKLDPTVRTYEEAIFVLKQNIAQNVGNNKSRSEDGVYCKHCGELIDADSKFCKGCGKEQ